ncbi:trypsin-like peptidase domain-containing protein [Gordonia sp. NPDC127522]|uniref:trypsin-like peptidase domain-containing protein n=1 Tax=Gordonia sp. NPDC127522 TaxID=3345390 RepID=UPI0036405FE5
MGSVAGAGAGLVAGQVGSSGALFAGAERSAGTLDAQQAADDLLPSVVQIRYGPSRGSGFALDDDGHTLSNAHMVDGGGPVAVATSDGRTMPARVVGVDRPTDVGVGAYRRAESAGGNVRPQFLPAARSAGHRDRSA